MLNKNIKLIEPFTFKEVIEEISITKSHVLIRPLYLSICAADLRYYKGERSENVLREKLPMSLIHEAIGEVLFDPKGEFLVGEKVVLIPNTPVVAKNELRYKENYERSSKFRSSGFDGFMQEIINMDRDRIISIGDIDPIAATMSELLSVIYNSLDDIATDKVKDGDTIGIWGNGNLGYLASCVLANEFPQSEILVFGRNASKNNIFNHASKTYVITEDLKDVSVDHAFECVGGSGSESAINQIIDVIKPQGHIALLGVSEKYPSINTRMVLEKGLTLQGSSRSGYKDFNKAVQFLKKSRSNQEDVARIVTELLIVRDTVDIKKAFDTASVNAFKTIMKWEI